MMRLRGWADRRGLEIRVSRATQHEPEHMVSVVLSQPPQVPRFLIRETSNDSPEVAALYLLNTLELLGVDVDA